MAHDVATLLTMSAAELDALFSSVEAGPVPDGVGDGTAIVAPGTAAASAIAGLVRVFAWQGKVFDAKDMVLRNRITVLGLRAIVARVAREPSWIDGKECIVLDYSNTSLVAHWVRDEIRLVGPGLYLGRVFWNKTRLIHFALQF